MNVNAILIRAVAWLPPVLRAHATQDRITLLAQFISFGLVGLVGLAIDTATVYALRPLIGVYAALVAAYFTAATGTWYCNRRWTFSSAPRTEAWYRQWCRFVAANLSGFAINRGVAFMLVTYVAAAAREPAIAVFAGAVAGMTLNFKFSRALVFR